MSIYYRDDKQAQINEIRIRQTAKIIYYHDVFKGKIVDLCTLEKSGDDVFSSGEHEIRMPKKNITGHFGRIKFHEIYLSPDYRKSIVELESVINELYKTKTKIKQLYGVNSKEFKEICNTIHPYKTKIRFLRVVWGFK